MLVCLLVFASGLGWLSHERRRVALRREFFDAWFNQGDDNQPQWHKWLFGDDWPAYAKGLETRKYLDDSVLEPLRDLPQLESLSLSGSNITDAGLASLE